MTCSCGKRIVAPVPIGIQCYPENVPALILFNCKCGSTRAIKWADATEPQRAAARIAELFRAATNKMMFRY